MSDVDTERGAGRWVRGRLAVLRTGGARLLLAAGQVLPALGQLLGEQREQNPLAAPLGVRVSGRNLGPPRR